MSYLYYPWGMQNATAYILNNMNECNIEQSLPGPAVSQYVKISQLNMITLIDPDLRIQQWRQFTKS